MEDTIAFLVWLCVVLVSVLTVLPVVLLISQTRRFKNFTTSKSKRITVLEDKYRETLKKYSDLLLQNSYLHGEIIMLSNKTRTLTNQLKSRPGPEFTREEINTLIRLCHPDKHAGKESATEITKKLLNMRQREE